jgi:hypothetical protein
VHLVDPDAVESAVGGEILDRVEHCSWLAVREWDDDSLTSMDQVGDLSWLIRRLVHGPSMARELTPDSHPRPMIAIRHSEV